MKTVMMLAALSLSAAAEVKVWQGTLTLPVYEEALPDVNPPFDNFADTRFNYPYTLRTNMSGARVERSLRALYLENEYLKCSVLPDIGGHVYSCTDKISGREMFYANPSLKKQLIGYRGAWAAFGIEFNFPVSHNWMSMSPVDFAMARHSDGSGSVTVGNIDRPYGMQWRVELILRPGSAVLEERVTLYNHGDMRRRYYWWNNAAAEVGDDSKIVYPMRYSASHGFTYVDTWPVNHEKLDVSVVKNHTSGPVSQFVHGSREPFMGVWHPRSNTGVVHYAEYADLPGKKVWSFGVDADGLDWRKALSDNNSGYVEIQAGLFRNQETYAFMPPQGTTSFSEYWMPVRDLGGISRANLQGVVFLSRREGRLRAALNVNQRVEGARVRIKDGARTVDEAAADLEPAKTFVREVAAGTGKLTFELLDGKGKLLLAHTEDTYDWTPDSEIKAGPQRVETPATAMEAGTDQELNGRLLAAQETYEKALASTPDDFGLLRASGRLAATLKNHDLAIKRLSRAQEIVSNDAEVFYYLGHAWVGDGEPKRARAQFEGAQRQPVLRVPALIQLALLDSREGNREGALARLREAMETQSGLVRAGALEAALLRGAGKTAEAGRAADEWLKQDPTNNFLRYEASRLGRADDQLWRHLASDPERVTGIAAEYLNLGLYGEALELLSRSYPAGDPLESEPGMPLPQDYALNAYYRAYCLEQLGKPAKEAYRAASAMPTRYVFPYRATDLLVIEAALKQNPGDAVAHYYLGNLRMSAGMTDAAIGEWREARAINPRIPVLHRNLGRTLLAVKHDDAAALEAYREGLAIDRTNVELYSGLSQAMSILGRPAAERAAALDQYPDRAAMPSSLVLDLALTYAEAGKFAEAEALFHNRYFGREEGGTNVRQVYLETQLLRAAAQPSAALAARIGKPVDGLEFTRDGMDPFLNSARVQAAMADIEKKMGNAAEARKHLEKAAAGRGMFATLAQRELGREDWRRRAEQSATSSYGVDRGLALMALGRAAEGREALHQVLRAPDRNLSHYMARRGLGK